MAGRDDCEYHYNMRSTVKRARLELDGGRLRARGEWTVASLGAQPPQLPLGVAGAVDLIDASDIAALDSAGALWLLHLAAEGGGVAVEGLGDDRRGLLDLVAARRGGMAAVEAPASSGGLLEVTGREACRRLERMHDFLAFIGEALVTVLRLLVRPARIRWRPVVANLQSAGVSALPIIGLLSFLIGVVIAYQGGQQLKLYGANIFIVELVGLTTLRELGPLIAAIIVAGRTGSAWTAQIGTMQVREEVDALRTMGISPMELLVLPKLLALVIALPLLTVYADLCGVFGGMVVAWLVLGVGFADFLARFPEVIYPSAFLVGVGKAPFFAAIIALVGCFEGFRVRGGAESVGHHTTLSVVQAIFLVIVADALFSVLFSWLDL